MHIAWKQINQTQKAHPIHKVTISFANYFSREKEQIDRFITDAILQFLDNVFIELTDGTLWNREKTRIICDSEKQKVHILDVIFTKINFDEIAETEADDDFTSVDVKNNISEIFIDQTEIFKLAYNKYKHAIDPEQLYDDFSKQSSNSEQKYYFKSFFMRQLNELKKSDFEYSKIILEKIFTDKTLWSSHLPESFGH